MNQKPTLGRIVWYQRHGSPDGTHKAEPSPAIITQVFDAEKGDVQLFVMNPNGTYHNRCQYSEEAVGGTWRWPDRV